MLTLLDVLNRTKAFFTERGIERAHFEAELILAHALKTDRLQLFLRFDQPMQPAELEAVRELVRRRAGGEPYAYIVGVQEFWSLDFAVGPGVLIPRPDTETLVQAVLDSVPIGEDTESATDLYIADICAGSGCVGIAIASERPRVKVYATELSEQALPFLKQNIAAHGMDKRVAALQGDLMAPIPASRPVDWVVSNPPYIATAEMQQLAVSKTEPHLALDGGPDGLVVYRRLIEQAAQRARVGIALEIGHDQGASVSSLVEAAGFQGVRVIQDLGGRDRVVLGTR